MPVHTIRPRCYQVGRAYHRSLTIAMGVVVFLAGIGLAFWPQGRPSAVEAAAGSRDGSAAKVLERDTTTAASASSAAPVAAPVGVSAPAVAPAASAPAPVAVAPVSAPAPARPMPLVAPGSNHVINEFFVHVPPTINGRLRVLVALHGMGGAGQPFCEAILSRTDREQWLVVAPTYSYGDWRDPSEVMREESSRFIPRLAQFLQELPARTGLELEPKAVLLGYSRGAQLAQRFAMIYPEQTQAVAAISAGTYTLPLSAMDVNGNGVVLNYPFGTADVSQRFGREFRPEALRGMPFYVGVGANDRNPADLPRHWDPYLGDNRVARAETFARRLTEAGAVVQLSIYPGVDHAIGEDVRGHALDFLASAR